MMASARLFARAVPEFSSAARTPVDSVPPTSVGGVVLACLPAVFAAAFAAASTAISALSAARRAALRDTLEGSRRAAMERYLENGVAIEARWLVVRSFGVVLAALLLAGRLPAEWGAFRLLAASLASVLAYAIPSEILRALASNDPERLAPMLLAILRPVELLAAPFSAPTVWLSRIVGGWLSPAPTPAPGVTETEVEMIVTEGELNGSLAREQSEMIRNVLEFGDITAGDVMVPRTQVTAFDVETPLAQALRLIAESGHSRYPVYSGSVDNVVGLLYAKDLLRHATSTELEGKTLEGLLRTPIAFVPDSQSGSSVLKDMRAGRHHMAIVIDEFGGMSGVLTLEDLLEKIVGDIRDEHDVDEPPIVDLGNGRLAVDASVPIADLSRYLGAELPSDGDYHSLAGFIIAQLGRVPEVGTQLSAYGLSFEVREADERRVSKVEITRLAPPESIVPRSASRITAA
jgi:CBS domain containing-hemolysin-like protein